MSEPEHPHTEPAELDMHVRARGELADHPAPRGKDLVAPAGITAEADGATDMVEHDLCLGKGTRQVDEFAELGVVHPRIKAEAEGREPGKALAHPLVQQQTRGPDDRRPPSRLVGMRGGDETD